MPIIAFAEGESGTGDYYEKITSVSQMESGARYLIVYENYRYVLDGSLGEDMDSASNYIEVDIDNDIIAATEELDEAAFEIDANAGTIKSVSGFYIGSSDSQNKLLTSETSDFVNEISFDNDDFEAGHQGTASHFMLQFSDSADRFRFYKNDGQNYIQLYKRVDAPVSYVNASGEAQEPIADYTTLTSSIADWTNGWYVLKNNVSYGGRVTVKGDNVNLILCDGATMNVKDGVLIREGYALTIWAQENGKKYNTLLNKKDDPDNDYSEDEHLMDYPIRYAYFLDMGYNKAGAPYAGNAIFLHCWKEPDYPTGGCVAVSEEDMVKILQTITPGTTVTIY